MHCERYLDTTLPTTTRKWMQYVSLDFIISNNFTISAYYCLDLIFFLSLVLKICSYWKFVKDEFLWKVFMFCFYYVILIHFKKEYYKTPIF